MSGGNRVLWPELAPEDVDGGWLADVPQVTAPQVLAAIARRHEMNGFNGMPGRWVFVREVVAQTGSYSSEQRFDAVAIGLVPSVHYARVVYEVKVSRGDWLRELRTEIPAWREIHLPAAARQAHRKWDAALAVSTEMWFAAPPRCILPSELPPEAGLVEVRPWGNDRELRARVVRQAPTRETPAPGPGFWAAVLRRAAQRGTIP